MTHTLQPVRTPALQSYRRSETNFSVEPWRTLLVSVIKIVIALGVLLTAVAYTVWLERKVVGHIQNRWGPTRVGPFGLLQPLADGVKFIFKEDLIPPHVLRAVCIIVVSMIALIFALTSISVVHRWQLDYRMPESTRRWKTADVNIGLLDLDAGRHFARSGSRSRACGVVFEQQVFAARWIARQRPDGELRNLAGSFARGRADSRG